MQDYLYQYTSTKSLKKILESKKILFRRLDLVDDLDEVKANDIKDFGKFFYVSCWTDIEDESIPMWKMYSNDMQGIRFKLKKFPFKSYNLFPGQYGVKEKISTFINFEERDRENQNYIFHQFPKLIEVDYTERADLLYPSIKSEVCDEKTIFIDKGKIVRTESKKEKKYTYDKFGEFKRKCWSFQSEWRYKIFVCPFTYKELASCKSADSQQHLLERLEDKNYLPNEENVFLSLSDDALSNMEILIGPKASEEMISSVLSIADEYSIDRAQIKMSNIRVR